MCKLMKTHVYILYTGGTIGMAPKHNQGAYSQLQPMPSFNLLDWLPGLQVLDDAESSKSMGLPLENGNLIELSLGNIKPVDSSDMTPRHWLAIARQIAALYSAYDGFVILHGTDTMAYTSSALSFMFEHLAKPVVVTGSQLPIMDARTDAIANVMHAIQIAGYQASGLPLIPEVILVFADKILRGCRATKISTSGEAAFDSPNFPPLGTIGEHITIHQQHAQPCPAIDACFGVSDAWVSQVGLLVLFPGIPYASLQAVLLHPAHVGIVLSTYGAGNAPSYPAFLRLIEQSVQGVIQAANLVETTELPNDRLIVNISQCTQGTVEMGLYEASSGILERGVLSGLDMTPEAALTKLMWTLGTQFGAGRVAQMQISQRGEQTENLFDLRYGAIAENLPVSLFTASTSPDGRLDRERISRAMLRISGLGVAGVTDGERVDIQVFMNMPRADHTTDLSEERCVATLSFVHEADKPIQMRIQNITYKAQHVIGNGDVILTLVTGSPDVKVFFKGLYLAIYAKA